MSSEKLKEEIVVLFHASLLGRTDIINKVLSNLRQEKLSTDDILSILSTQRPDDELTPLHIAAEKGHADACRALLHAGAFVSAKPSKGDHAGKTPYQIAINSSKIIFNVYLFEQIAFGNVENVAKLLDGGISASIIDDSKHEDSALHWATSFAQLVAVRELISRGAHINYQNSAGKTALHLACNPGNVEIIKVLLDHGADLSIADNQGKTAKDILNPPNTEIDELLANPPPATFSLISKQQNVDASASASGEIISHEAALSSEEPPSEEVLSSSNELSGTPQILNLASKPHFHSILNAKSIEDAEASDELPLFVLWPPPQRQKRFASPPLQLNSCSNLLICVASTDIDIFPLLTWSGLMDAFDRYGFQAQVKRTSPGAKIRLCISQNVCPGRDRYEIVIRSDFALITASDETSLLYAVQTFVQIIHLYSDVKFDDSTSTLHIPALSISDWCDVPNRAVSWSFRSTVRNATAGTRDVIEMLSRLRMNMIYLMIDTNTQQENSETVVIEESVSTKIYSLDEVCRRQAIELVPTLVLSKIDQRLPLEILKNFSHEMIALVFVYDSVPCDDLTMVQYVMLCQAACEQILFEVQSAGFLAVTLSCSDWVLSVASISTLAIHLGLHVIERTVDEMMPTALFSRPLVSPAEYIKVLTHYSLRVKQSGASLAIAPAFTDTDFLYPSILVKMCCFYYGGFVWNREAVLEILDITPHDLNVNPNDQPIEAVSDPDLSNLLYGIPNAAGLVGNFAVPKKFGTLIREVLKFILFPSGDIESSSGGYGTSTGNGAAIGTAGNLMLSGPPGKGRIANQKASPSSNVSPLVLDLMTGNLDQFFDAPTSSSSSGLSENAIHLVFPMEKYLWPIITSNVALESFPLPNKQQAAHCLRFFKKILQMANWKLKIGSKSGFDLSRLILGTDSAENSSQTHKLEEFQFPLEFEELFAVINLLAIVCKAVVLVHNIKEKAAKATNGKVPLALMTDFKYSRQSLGSLLKNVPQGMKSDLANSLLESIEHLSLVWRHRFEKMNLENMANQFKSSSSVDHINLTVVDQWLMEAINVGKDDSKFTGCDLNSLWLKYSQATLLLHRNSSIPVASLFRCMIDQLIMPESVEQTIKQLFSQQ